MRDIRRGLWLMAIGATLFVAGQMMADGPAKLNPKGFKHGCVCVGETYRGGASYEKVLVVAITPEAVDYWVFYPEFIEDRHRRADGKLITLRLPVARFLPRNTVRQGKLGRLKCPDIYWGADTGTSAER